MGYRHHGVTTGGLPVDYIKRFKAAFDIPIFIETGTAGGESVREAAKIFQECHTIEIIEGRAGGDYPNNVTLHHGNSPDLLPEIVRRYSRDKHIFFWLDAHYSEPHESEPDTVECPIIGEIQAIRTHKKAVIMIDDARLFLGPPKWPCDYVRWPQFGAVFNALQACFTGHFITVVDDYIICIPEEMKDIFRDEWWERQDIRFPTEEQKKRNAIKQAWFEVNTFLNNL